MKNNIINLARQLLLTVFTLTAIVACDKIEAPYKKTGSVIPETPTKKVLLEDYTGHNCVNCPAAAKLALSLQQLYGERMIMMTVHSGFFARPASAPFNTDYRTPAGEAWDQFFAISNVGNPNGMINRKSTAGNYVVGPGNWGTRIAEIIDDEAVVKLDLNTTYNSATRKLDINLSASFVAALAGEFKLIVCILEDSLISAQKNNDASVGTTPTILNYVHRHVLRENVNGIWGESLVADPQPLTPYTKSYSLNLNPLYNQKNSSVLAFLYDSSTYEIIQVEEKKLQ